MGKHIMLAVGAIALAACGGSEFGGLGPAAASGDAGALVMTSADAPHGSDGGELLEDGGAGELGPEASPGPAADGSPASRPDAALERDADGDRDAAAAATDAGGGEGEGGIACSSASACPSCGSAVSYPCCSARGLCGCSFTLGGACTAR